MTMKIKISPSALSYMLRLQYYSRTWHPLDDTLSDAQIRELWDALGGKDGYPKPFPSLVRAHLSVAETARTPDEDLLMLRNVGPSTVRQIRQYIPYRGPDQWLPYDERVNARVFQAGVYQGGLGSWAILQPTSEGDS